MLVAIAMTLSPGVARAQSAEAETLFGDGVRAMDAGRVDEACAAFEASNRLDPRAGTLLRLGDCREAQGRLASAWSAFTDARARARDPRKRRLAERRIAAIEPRLSRLTIAVPRARRIPGLVISRDGVVVDPLLWDRPHPVDGGALRVVARAPGHVTWETRVVVSAEGGAATVEMPALAPVLPPRVADEPDAPAPAAGGLDTRRKLALGVGAGGALVAGGAVYLGWRSRQLTAQARDVCPATSCVRAIEANRLVARARDHALWANVGYGVAGAAAVSAAVLWFTGGREVPSVMVRPTMTSGAAGAAVVGRF